MTTTAAALIAEAASQLARADPKAAADEIRAGTAIVVDVREPEEWQHGHIDGSVPAPRGLLEFFADPTSPRYKKDLDPDRRVIVVSPPARGRHSPGSPSRPWATGTSPSSPVGSRAG